MANTQLYTYKNTTDNDLEIIGVGVVEAGGEITSPQELNSPNLELVKTKAGKPTIDKEGKE